MSQDTFTTYVAKALDELPPLFREKMDNVEIIVEDFAGRETLDALGAPSRWMILGLYSGVPIPHQSFFDLTVMPHRIYLYRRPILREAETWDNVVTVIRDVLVHEVGHHFGFDDEELERLQSEAGRADND